MDKRQDADLISGVFPAAIAIPCLALLLLVTFLITGFHQVLPFLSNSYPDNTLSLPIYVGSGILLLFLQAEIALDKSWGHRLYLLATAGVALAYIGYVLVTGRNAQITRNAALYEITEAMTLGIFLFDVMRRFVAARWRRQARNAVAARSGQRGSGAIPTIQQASEIYRALAADAAGLAILCLIFWGLLGLLTNPGLAQSLHLCPTTQPDCVYVDATLPGFLPASTGANGINLINVNVVLAAVAGVIWMLFMLFVALTDDRGEIGFLQALIAAARATVDRVLVSLRLVLNPVVWLIPASCIALFAYTNEMYLTAQATTQCKDLNLFLTLFSPIGPCSVPSLYVTSLKDIAVLVIAFGAVIAAVAVAEHNFDTSARAAQILGSVGRRLMLGLVFFIYALGGVNAVVVLIARIFAGNHPPQPAAPEPFRVGAAGIIALVVCIFVITFAAVRDRMVHSRVPKH